MAYNNSNHLKRAKVIIDLYLSVKEHDRPDTYILKNIFPKHGVHISYRTLMYYKSCKIRGQEITNPAQMALFN